MIWAGLIAFGIAVTPLLKMWGALGNWRASFLFVAAIILVRIVFYFSFSQPILAMAVVYSVMAALGAFYIDRLAGAFMALISLIIATQLIGVLPQFPRQIVGEVVWIAGVICCGLVGPSGGIYGPQFFRAASSDSSGPSDIVAPVASHHKDVGEDQAG